MHLLLFTLFSFSIPLLGQEPLCIEQPLALTSQQEERKKSPRKTAQPDRETSFCLEQAKNAHENDALLWYLLDLHDESNSSAIRAAAACQAGILCIQKHHSYAAGLKYLTYSARQGNKEATAWLYTINDIRNSLRKNAFKAQSQGKINRAIDLLSTAAGMLDGDAIEGLKKIYGRGKKRIEEDRYTKAIEHYTSCIMAINNFEPKEDDLTPIAPEIRELLSNTMQRLLIAADPSFDSPD